MTVKSPFIFGAAPETIYNKYFLYQELVDDNEGNIKDRLVDKPVYFDVAPERILAHYAISKLSGREFKITGQVRKNPLKVAQKKLDPNTYERFKQVFDYLDQLSRKRRGIKNKVGGHEAETSAYIKHASIIERLFGSKAHQMTLKDKQQFEEFVDSVIKHIERRKSS